MGADNFARADNLFFWVQGTDNPTDADWDRYLAFIAQEAPKMVEPRGLIFSDGGSPSAAQRKRLNDAVAPYAKPRAAVLTTSVMVRGAMTALNWFIPMYRAFAPTQLDEALRFLEVPEPKWQSVRQRLNELRLRIGTAPVPE